MNDTSDKFQLINIFYPTLRKKTFSFMKSRGTWWNLLVLDLFAIPLTLLLKKLNRHVKLITPNAISLFSFVIFFLGVAIMFELPDKFLSYTFIFFVASVLDAVDGKLARSLDEKSDLGAIVDAFFDMFNQSIGLVLVSLALSIKVNDFKILLVVLPYSLYLGAIHINAITEIINKKKYVGPTADPEVMTGWQKFCKKRGLRDFIYGDIETIYMGILLIGINLPDPLIWLIFLIYSRFVAIALRKFTFIKIMFLRNIFG